MDGEDLALVFAAACIAALAAYALLLKAELKNWRPTEQADGTSGGSSSGSGSGGGHALLVTAHPDDECMFFGPSLFHFQRRGWTVHILCLSTGNFDNLGSTRAKELVEAAKELGIPASRVTVLDIDQLRDGPRNSWDPSVVAAHVKEAVRKSSISLLLTFDARGVSEHPNHKQTHAGVAQALSDMRSTRGFELVTTSKLRKYAGLLDILVSMFDDHLLLASPGEVLRIQRAMKAHVTQNTWYRRLFMVFSRYVVLNTISEMHSVNRDS